LITEADINKSLLRLLIGRFDLGEMDEDAIVPWTKIPTSVINNDEHKKLALDMAHETMTLLQNKNNILPLNKTGKKIAVIGPNADNARVLWGNYNGTPIHTITILDGIKSKVPGDKIYYDKACDIVDNKVLESFITKCSIDGKPGFKATYWNNKSMTGNAVANQQLAGPLNLATEGKSALAPGVQLEGFSAKFETEFTPSKTEDILFKYGAAGSFELLVNGASVTKFEDWRTMISKTTFKVEEGKKYKIEIHFTQLNNWQAAIEFNLGRESDLDYSGLLNKLKGIDVVVFVGGLSNALEGEEMPVSLPGFKGGDRTDIELPAVQRNCIKTLKQSGKKVIFVNCSGSAIGFVPETENCDAILQAWYGGESGGQAVADVLFGDFNPSGKLPVTFYSNAQQLPDFENYSMKGRTYRYMSDPLFPFGFGLSYTTFSIGTAEISRNKINKDGNVELTVPVSNTGKRTGTEIIQVYVHKVNDTYGPLKTLKGFMRIELAAGKSGQAVVNLTPASFEFFDRTSGKMNVIPGDYEIWYGSSSDVRDLKMAMVTIQ
jgi:beta-glucosidase